jgi:Flp pilus assembly protein TadD
MIPGLQAHDRAPSSAESMHLLNAEEMQRRGDLASAVEQYQLALGLNPGCFAAWNNLGTLFASLKDWNTAKTFLQEAERLNPQNAVVQSNLGNVLEHCGQTELSIERYRVAITLEPENPQFQNNLGNALRCLGDWPAAEQMLTSAIALKENYPVAHVNLAYLYYEQGRLADAERLYRAAIALDSGLALAHTCLSRLLLRRGAFREGWQEQEWRWQWEDFPSPRRHFQQPQWYGEDLRGRRILLHAEQGLGDTIQFVRYVPMVAALGAHVTLEVHPELVSLMGSVEGVSALVARGDALPSFDLHCPLMSLPLAFGTTLETIPRGVPYLHANGPAPAWVHQMDGASLRVGLVWAGNPANRVDGRRSIPLGELRQLFSIPGVDFYSFQRGGIRDPEERLQFRGVLPDSGDFAATAAALGEMDLLISVDTAVAHLAGALGVPVWILLPRLADWRWLEREQASPWYRSARLFRQTEDKQWNSVVASVTDELQAWATTRVTQA